MTDAAPGLTTSTNCGADGGGNGITLLKTALLWAGNFMVTLVILTGALLAAVFQVR